MNNNSDKKLIPTDDVMDYRGLSAYLKLSYGYLRHKVMNNEIPFVKIGASVRFSKKKIDIWLDKKNQGGDKQRKISENAKGTDKKNINYDKELFIDDEENK